jgi:hypothetical protein
MSTPRVVVSFFSSLLLSASWLNKRTWVLHIRFCFVLFWLPPSVVIFSDLCILLSFAHIFTSFYLFFLSLPSNFFSFILIGAFCFMNPQMMVMLIIMTFIYHIRSVMPFTQIYLYTNTSQPNRLNSIQDTSCVNKSSTDQFLFFVLSSHFSEVWFFYQADDLLLFEHDTFIVIRMIKVFISIVKILIPVKLFRFEREKKIVSSSLDKNHTIDGALKNEQY